MPLTFPPGFVWGTATSAHQVEGANFNNDWWDWEQTPGHIRNGDTSRVANGWFAGRYREDFQRAADLGTTALRLSVEWSRLEPSEGQWDQAAFDFYREMLESLRECGLSPLVTLHHFTNPHWLAADGGWENPAVVQRFARFTRKVAQEFGSLCDFWVTVNEPNNYMHDGWLGAGAPPGKSDLIGAFRVLRHMIRAHAAAYYAIKDIQPQSRVGIAHHVQLFEPDNPNSPLDRLIAGLIDHIFNRLILEAIETGHIRLPLGLEEYWPEVRGTEDYIGLNFYYVDRIRFNLRELNTLFGERIRDEFAAGLAQFYSETGNIEARGFEKMIHDTVPPGKPIFITENGVFDNGRNLQAHYMVTHLAALHRAIQAGADVRGFFWWSLVDNFEWKNGYSSRFGLYSIDLDTQVRTPRPVADVFARIVHENGIDDELLARYENPD